VAHLSDKKIPYRSTNINDGRTVGYIAVCAVEQVGNEGNDDPLEYEKD
jgi:hypothetical protein